LLKGAEALKGWHDTYNSSWNNDVSGNHIYNAKNVHYGFDIKSGEDSKYAFTVRSLIDSYDISFTTDIESAYNSLTCQGKDIFCSHYSFSCNNIFYSEHCYNSHDIFGCNGLKSAQYCILNKQYTKEEYKSLKTRLIEHMKKTGEWGKFFPHNLSPFAYNEAVINEYYFLSKEQAIATGYWWEDELPTTTGQETMVTTNLPEKPEDFSDDLAKQILSCESCHRNYKLIPMEIGFYKNIGLALPKECFHCRQQKRMDKRNPRVLFPAKCSKCNKEIKTSYPSDKQEKLPIYCEQCYQAEVV